MVNWAIFVVNFPNTKAQILQYYYQYGKSKTQILLLCLNIPFAMQYP